MEFNLFASRYNGRHDTNFILRREYPICLTGHPNIPYQNNIENFSQSYAPLQDITGSIFGGFIHESRNGSFNESNYSINNRDMIYNRDRVDLASNRHRNRNFDRNLGLRFNRNGMFSNNRRVNLVNDTRTLNRSLSMSSPNIEYGINSLNNANGMTENNSSYMNRSRSFADRILDQFDALEREHSHLTDRIHRSQSIYEQIQRSGADIEQIFENISRRVERRHTQRDYPTRFNHSRNCSHSVLTSRRNANRRTRTNEARFASLEEFHNMIHNQALNRANLEFENENEENEIIELIQIDEDDINDLMLRRNEDIRSHSLIIDHEEILEEGDYEDEDEDEDDENNINHREDIYNYDQNEQEEDEATELEIDEDGMNDSLNVDSRDRLISNRNGIPLEIQHALPISKFDIKRSQSLDQDKKTCLICLEEFKDQQEILWLPCTHCFCRKCITSWFKRGTACPICKDDVLSHFRE